MHTLFIFLQVGKTRNIDLQICLTLYLDIEIIPYKMETGRCWYCGSEDVEHLQDGTHFCHECGTQWGKPRYQYALPRQRQKPLPPPLDLSKPENWLIVLVGALIVTCIIHILIIPFFLFIFDDNFLFRDSLTTGWGGFFIELLIIYLMMLALTSIGILR